MSNSNSSMTMKQLSDPDSGVINSESPCMSIGDTIEYLDHKGDRTVARVVRLHTNSDGQIVGIECEEISPTLH